MAEFCLDCLNKELDEKYKPYQVKFFHGKDICEDCGEYKKLVAKVNILGELSVGLKARKEYKLIYGKPYKPIRK